MTCKKTRLVVELRHPQAKMPHKAHPTDACFDLYLPEEAVIQPGETRSLDVGLALQLEEGWEAQVCGRSGLATRGLWVHLGTIDHLYRQNLWVIVHNLNSQPLTLAAGDRVAQLRICRVWPVDLIEATVEKSDRGGLGSTGR